MKEVPAISVLVPTRDRNEALRELLNSLGNQTLPASRFEVIVIDNSPARSAEETVSGERKTSPLSIRYLHQPAPGKSRAMNLGIEAARSELLAATDDDCLPAADWLETVVAGFAGEDEETCCLTGRVVPEEGREDYAAVGLDRAEKATYRGRLARLRAGTAGNGSNAAYRRRSFDELGGFLPAFGPGSPLHCGEETEFFDRLLAAGKKIVFLPTAVVRHRPRRTAAENLRMERESLRARGVLYALRLRQGDPWAAALLAVRLLACPPAAAFFRLRKLLLPGRPIPFWHRFGGQIALLRGFASSLLDPRLWN